MEPDKYIQERLDKQQKWYSKESGINKKYYYRMKITIVILAILIPLVSVITNFVENYFVIPKESVGFITGAFGAAVAILTSISELLKFKEKYVNYRTASERLKSEKFLWTTGTNPYDKENSFNILVDRVEAIIKVENGDWGAYIVKENDDKKGVINEQ